MIPQLFNHLHTFYCWIFVSFASLLMFFCTKFRHCLCFPSFRVVRFIGKENHMTSKTSILFLPQFVGSIFSIYIDYIPIIVFPVAVSMKNDPFFVETFRENHILIHIHTYIHSISITATINQTSNRIRIAAVISTFTFNYKENVEPDVAAIQRQRECSENLGIIYTQQNKIREREILSNIAI